MKKLCVIGGGTMGAAIAKGIIDSEVLKPSEIVMTDSNLERVQQLSKELGVCVGSDNCEAVAESEVILLALKPQVLNKAAAEFRELVKPEAVVVSIAAGRTIASLEEIFPAGAKIVRAMPNTPALVREGMTQLCRNQNVTDDELQNVVRMFNSVGLTREIPEKLIDTAMAITSSSPAYVCLFIEALADAGVKAGLDRKQSLEFAKQAVMGTAKLLLEQELHPAVLKDMVCSPGGTSIAAVAVLEEKGMRTAVIQAVEACVKRAKEL